MADNYLEKQMEDFRAGRLGKTPARRSAAPQSLLPPSARILVVCRSLECASRILCALSPCAGKIAAAIPASKEATALTQRLGVRFYPVAEGNEPDMDAITRDLLHVWHALSLVISDYPPQPLPYPTLTAEGDLTAPALGEAIRAMALLAVSTENTPASLTIPGLTITLTK